MTKERSENVWRRALTSMPVKYAFLFLVGLLVFEYLFFPRIHGQHILGRHIEAGNYLRLFAVLSLSVVSGALGFAFVVAAFASSSWLRVLYFLVFSLSIIAEYGCYQAIRRFSTMNDVALAVFAGDWRFTAEAAAMYFNYLSLIPIAVFGVGLFITRTCSKYGPEIFASVLISIASFFTLSTYFTSNTYHTISFSSSFRSLVGFSTGWYIGTSSGDPEGVAYHAPRQPVDFQATTTPKNNIVFIVDESVRADHLSLNGYGKPTTPFLEKLHKDGFLKNWGVAAAGATCSVDSHKLLLTGVNELPDRNLDIYRLPTVFRFARSMNYKTFYFDGQVSQFWNGKPADKQDYDVWVKADELAANVGNKYDVDAEIARRIREITRLSTGNFIWVIKRGVHKPYTASYPNEKNGNGFDGFFISYDSRVDQQTLIDEYDKAITYNLDNFFSSLFGDAPETNTVYLYTSDHGQTLREGGSTVSHCSDTKPEAIVPLFLVGDPNRFDGIDETYKAAHTNIFSALLDLLEFPESERKYPYGLSLLKAKGADSTPRTYFAGDLQGKHNGRKLPFD